MSAPPPDPTPAAAHGGDLSRAVAHFARVTPVATAVVAGEEQVSYAELDARANRIAACLREMGAAPGVLVALCLPPGIGFVSALLGVLRAGAAYLPLDPAYPAARLRRVAARAAPRLLVTEAALAARTGLDVPALRLDADAARLAAAPSADAGHAAGPADPCYVIFTSGSTGEPKGVVVTRGNVARLFTHLGPRLALGSADVWSQLHSGAFGFSVFEIWGALTTGARLAVAPPAARADALALREFLRASGVTVLSQTPTAFRATLLAPAWTGSWPSLAVRLVVLSGEAVIEDDLRRWSASSGVHGPRLVNTYAITETGGNVMFREYGPADHAARDLGEPLPDVGIAVLDAAARDVPGGGTGELYVGGPGVAAGYINDPELTAARFVALPGRTQLYYRTGDLVRVRDDGRLDFMGRADDQVKWHGFRLELGEIESLLRTHPGVTAAAAAIHADESGNEKLVAYVVPGAGASPPQEPEFWPSLGGYQVYDDFLYDLMSTDTVRNQAFRSAFARCARDRVVLDLGTGPHALLARLAAEAGARHVYAVEVLPEAARKARAAVAAAGLAGRITVIEGDAAALSLPQPAELCTQGIIGNIGSADGIAPIWNRVRAQLAGHCAAVPARCTTRIAAVELPEALRERPALAPLAAEYVQRIFAAEGRAFDLRLCVRNLPPGQLLSASEVFEELDFSAALPESVHGAATFTLQRAGRFDGFLLWTVVTLADGVELDYLEHQHAWLPVFMPLPEDGPPLPAGAVIRAEWQWQAGAGGVFPDYTLHSEIEVDGARRRYSYTTRHHETARGATALHRRLLEAQRPAGQSVGPGELRAYLARHLPEPLLPNAWMYLDALPTSPNGKLDRRALPAPAARTWGGQGGAPQTALESDLAAIWSEILGVSAVGVQDNFFDLGGDSVTAVRLTTRVQQLLDDGVMLAAVFESPTIAALARYLAEHHGAAVESRYGARRPHKAAAGARRSAGRTHGEL